MAVIELLFFMITGMVALTVIAALEGVALICVVISLIFTSFKLYK